MSRTVLVSLFIIGVVYLLSQSFFRKRLLLLALPVLFAFEVAMWVLKNDSSIGRLHIWKISWPLLLKQSMWKGIGSQVMVIAGQSIKFTFSFIALNFLMRYFFLFSFLLLSGVASFAQPKLQVQFNKTSFLEGDTLVFDAQIENNKLRYSTLHLMVEDLAHSRQWAFRYPLEDGMGSAWLTLSNSLPPGVYAFNFLLRKELVHIMGFIKGKKPPEAINYVASGHNQNLIVGTLKVDAAGGFQLPNLLLDNKATFVFTPVKKSPDNWLDIELETPVDSAFVPLATYTAFITVGKPLSQVDTVGYTYSPSQFLHPPSTLQNVVVTGKAKTQAEKLVEKFQGGVFDGRGYLFDGMEDNAITAAGTVFDFLIGRVPGLDILHNRVDFSFQVLWRGFEPVYFVDGMETDKEGILAVAANEVAAIKVISPPFYWTSMGSAGGAIAIFTKRGNGGSRYGNKFRFVVNGYTPQQTVWQ